LRRQLKHHYLIFLGGAKQNFGGQLHPYFELNLKFCQLNKKVVNYEYNRYNRTSLHI